MTISMKFVLCIVVAFGAIGVFFVWIADPLYLKAPKDQTLFTLFEAKRSAFEQLRKMVIEDSESYITSSDLDARLDAPRRQEYRALLSEIGSGLIVRSDRQSVRFIFANGGLSAIGPGWLKGIEYLLQGPAREGVVVDSLDRPASLAVVGVYLRQIDPHWFLIFQKTD
jgi:hypothetical protein